MVSSVMSEGLKGMQSSQREMQKSAQDIARVNSQSDLQQAEAKRAEDEKLVTPVEETKEDARAGNIAEPIVELKRQEQIFNASAEVVSVASDALGSLIDVKS